MQIKEQKEKEIITGMYDLLIRKKKIYKGKIAPQGSQFIVVEFKRRVEKVHTKYTNQVLVNGSCNDEDLKRISDLLIEQIKQNYKLT